MIQINQSLTLFLIGATGDLAKKKILKALYQLTEQHLLPEKYTIIGIARADFSRDQFHAFVKAAVEPKDEEVWSHFAVHLYFVSGDVTKLETLAKLKQFHEDLGCSGNHLWYIATLPSLYIDVIHNIKAVSLEQNPGGWTKVMMEKPFGTDLSSSRLLDHELLDVFTEDQIYRIDHFLAKETVQNLLVFRFANGIFENLWNHNFVDHIQVQSTETLGVGGREVFYDQTGTVRDVVQNHVLQMIAMTLMEQPATLNASDVREQRRKILEELAPLDEANLQNISAFGQYVGGQVNGEDVKGYQAEHEILQNSTTETAVALKIHVKNERWQGVPIYIRAGKRMKQTVTQISIHFKEPANHMFKAAGVPQAANVLTLRIGPNEGVNIHFHVKKPGIHLELQEVPMAFTYKQEFQMDLVEAYVKLIYDAVESDPSLFPSANTIEESWKFIEPILNFRKTVDFRPDPYVAGSTGPDSFDRLIEKDGRKWLES
jgi:glucose-6-phosphate 1-dehydrogenase